MSTPMYTEPPQRSGLTTALVAGATIALLASVIYLFVQLDRLQTDMAKMKEQFNNELTNQKESSSVATAAHQKRIEDSEGRAGDDPHATERRDQAHVRASQAGSQRARRRDHQADCRGRGQIEAGAGGAGGRNRRP